MLRLKSLLDVIVTAAMGIAAVSVIWRAAAAPGPGVRQQVGPPAIEDISSSGLTTSVAKAPQVGAVHAPVVLIEYSDFECPFCARHAMTTYKEIARDFIETGRVRYVFRNFPLEQIHPAAVASAHAADCASRQGKFMEMRVHLFSNQKSLAGLDWADAASRLRLDANRFAECLEAADAKAIEAEKVEAIKFGVSSTPTFLIGRANATGEVALHARVSGAVPYATFRAGLEELLAQTQ